MNTKYKILVCPYCEEIYLSHFGKNIENKTKYLDCSCGSNGSHEIFVSFCVFCKTTVGMDITNVDHPKICQWGIYQSRETCSFC